ESSLLTQWVAVVGGHGADTGGGVRRLGLVPGLLVNRLGGHRPLDVDHLSSPHCPHTPKNATCPTSIWNPRSAVSRSTSGPSRSGAISSTVPQVRQTRCTCWSPPTAW